MTSPAYTCSILLLLICLFIAAFFQTARSSWYERYCTNPRALSVSGVGDMVANLTVLCDRDRAHLTAVSNGLHVTAIRLAQECSFQTGLNQSNINSTENEIDKMTVEAGTIEETFPDLSPMPANQRQYSDIECKYYGCYVGDAYSYDERYFFTFPTATCTFSQLSTTLTTANILPSSSTFGGHKSEYDHNGVTLSESLHHSISHSHSTGPGLSHTSRPDLFSTSSVMKQISAALLTSNVESITRYSDETTLSISYDVNLTNHSSSSGNTKQLLWLLTSSVVIVFVSALLFIICLLLSTRRLYRNMSTNVKTIYKKADIFEKDFTPVHYLKPSLNKAFSDFSISTRLDPLDYNQCSKSTLTVNVTDNTTLDQSCCEQLLDLLESPINDDPNLGTELGSIKNTLNSDNHSPVQQPQKQSDTQGELENTQLQEHSYTPNRDYSIIMTDSYAHMTELKVPGNTNIDLPHDLCSGFLLDQDSDNSFTCEGLLDLEAQEYDSSFEQLAEASSIIHSIPEDDPTLSSAEVKLPQTHNNSHDAFYFVSELMDYHENDSMEVVFKEQANEDSLRCGDDAYVEDFESVMRLDGDISKQQQIHQVSMKCTTNGYYICNEQVPSVCTDIKQRSQIGGLLVDEEEDSVLSFIQLDYDYDEDIM